MSTDIKFSSKIGVVAHKSHKYSLYQLGQWQLSIYPKTRLGYNILSTHTLIFGRQRDNKNIILGSVFLKPQLELLLSSCYMKHMHCNSIEQRKVSAVNNMSGMLAHFYLS